MKEQDLRDNVLRTVLEFKHLVKAETTAMLMEAHNKGTPLEFQEKLDLNEAVNMKMADLLMILDELIERQFNLTREQYSPQVLAVIDACNKRVNERLGKG